MGVAFVCLCVIGATGVAAAEEVSSADAAPDRLMARLQATYIWQRKPGFAAPYSGPNSLSTDGETGYTLSATLFVGARPWRHTEVFANPEVIQSQNISALHGLGGPTNGEAQKSGGVTPTLYLARLFVRQTIPLGGNAEVAEEAANQFAGVVASRRIVLTVGNVSILDVFDPNPLTHDSRTQFLNWALLTHGAFDYAGNARGYQHVENPGYNADRGRANFFGVRTHLDL
jgi:high affinity Mn2+ porin